MPETYHSRRLNRLREYDYAQPGAYFITLCVKDRLPLFGSVSRGAVHLNAAGQAMLGMLADLPSAYPHVRLDKYVVMPDHLHAILVFRENAPAVSPAAVALPSVMGQFKSLSTYRYGQGVKNLGWRPYEGQLWQRSFYDHVVRDQEDLNRVRQYIADNPLRWSLKRGEME